MNRRQFFSAAAVAPVALPMAVKASLAEPTPVPVLGFFRHSPPIMALPFTTMTIRECQWVELPELHLNRVELCGQRWIIEIEWPQER